MGLSGYGIVCVLVIVLPRNESKANSYDQFSGGKIEELEGMESFNQLFYISLSEGTTCLVGMSF